MSRWGALAVVVIAACLPLTEVGAASSKEAQKLEKQLKDRDPSVRAQAAWDLGQMGATESVPALAAALTDRSDAVRANAAASLWKFGAASKPAQPALEAALDDPSAAVVGNAAGALAKLGVTIARLVPAYRRVLGMPECESKVVGLKGMVGDVPPTELFDAAWMCSQVGDDTDVKHEAGEVLRKILKRRDRVMVPQVLNALKTLGDRDPSDLTSAISDVKPPVEEAVPVLVRLLTSKNERAPRPSPRCPGSSTCWARRPTSTPGKARPRLWAGSGPRLRPARCPP